MNDVTELDFPTVINPVKKIKDKEYMIVQIPIKQSRYLGITEKTPLLVGIPTGTKSLLFQPMSQEPNSEVVIPSPDVEEKTDKSSDDSATRSQKLKKVSLASG